MNFEKMSKKKNNIPKPALSTPVQTDSNLLFATVYGLAAIFISEFEMSLLPSWLFVSRMQAIPFGPLIFSGISRFGFTVAAELRSGSSMCWAFSVPCNLHIFDSPDTSVEFFSTQNIKDKKYNQS